MKPLNDDNFVHETATGRTIVMFWAKWAGPCSLAREKFDAASRYNDAGAEFATFDLDDNPTIPYKYGVKGVPCFMIFSDGKPLGSVVGHVPVDAILETTHVV